MNPIFTFKGAQKPIGPKKISGLFLYLCTFIYSEKSLLIMYNYVIVILLGPQEAMAAPKHMEWSQNFNIIGTAWRYLYNHTCD